MAVGTGDCGLLAVAVVGRCSVCGTCGWQGAVGENGGYVGG